MACSDVNAIMVGYRGQVAKLKAIHGGASKTPDSDKPPKPGANFRSMVKWHNAKFEAKKKRGGK